MDNNVTKQKTILITSLFYALLVSYSASAETTTTTTTTNPDGSTTVQETTTQTTTTGTNVIGPTGVTGTIRRSNRRQDRRMEEDLENLGDAAKNRPRSRR